MRDVVTDEEVAADEEVEPTEEELEAERLRATQAHAKAHYAERYHLQMVSTPDNHWLYGYLAGLGDVESVFEFGCNAGRHLHQLQRQGFEVAGMDLSPRALEAARLHHRLDDHALMLGDESDLARVKTGVFDAVLTVSVLSHMPDIGRTLEELQRIAKKHVILVETRSRGDANNYWWVHDYPGTPVHSYHAGQVNAVYQVWHERKSS